MKGSRDCKRSFILCGVARQCFAEKQARGEVDQDILDIQVNPAAWEISGHIVLKRQQDYEVASDEYACRLLAEVSLAEEAFEEVKNLCMRINDESVGFFQPPAVCAPILHAGHEEDGSSMVVKATKLAPRRRC